VWTVPFQVGGPQVSSDAVAEMPRESERPDSRASTSVMWTVSLSIEPARQATISVFVRALSSHSVWSSDRAVGSNLKALGMLLGVAAATVIAAPALRSHWSLVTKPQDAADVAGEIATPQGILPAGIFLMTCIFAASMTVTSFDGPFAV
jgi:hypothetical protein